jgi:hypothetical protein
MKKIFLISTIILCSLFNLKSQAQLVQAQTGYYIDDAWYPWTEEWMKLDGNILSIWSCVAWDTTNNGALKIAVFDSLCQPWVNPGVTLNGYDSYGSYNCHSYNTYAFDFYFSSDAHRTTVKNFIQNIIPQDAYVLIMTHQSNHCSLWNDSLIAAFQSIGSSITNINRINDNAPYIILGKKGAGPGSVPEITGMPFGNLITLSDSIHCNANSIAEINTDPAISFFPNPASDGITIMNVENSTIEILNIEGQIIRSINSAESHTSIEISGLARGMYFVKVSSEKGIAVKKFIKE